MHKTIDEYPPKRINPYIALMVTVPALFLTVWIVFYLNLAIQWLMAGHWGIFLWVVIPTLFVLACIGAWKAYVHFDRHQEEKRDREEYRQFLAIKRQGIHIATSRGYNVKITEEGHIEIINPISLLPAGRASETLIQQMEALPVPGLPGPCDFADILEVWRPSQQEILLALGPGGQRIVAPLKSLCHVALAGATGGGKSALMRLLLPQIEYVGAKVLLADPHFAPIDMESGDDWRPIASRLALEPAVSYQAIKDVLAWMALKELPARLERRRKAEPVGDAIFLGIDELPAIVKHLPEAPDLMADLLREGRKVGLYLISAAQDWLVKTIGGSGAVRDCFRTAFYVGGDTTSARVLLDVNGRVDDGGLGKGIVMLRSLPTPNASLVRVPWASNDAISALLATYPSTANPLGRPLQNTVIMEQSSTAKVDTGPILDARALRIRDLVRERTQQSKIIEEVWGISAKTGGEAYRKAARELSAIMATLIGGL